MPSDLSRTTQVNITPIIGLNLYGPIWKGHASAIRVILGPFCLLSFWSESDFPTDIHLQQALRQPCCASLTATSFVK